ncbi:MAG: hypothetical protein JXA95_17465 [Spirochaetales bacterium]|nr:hypothetical protein [Spirochaetales bacterium]
MGIVNTGADSSAFLAAALQEAGLNVREFDFYSLLSSADQERIDSRSRFVYKQDLSKDASAVVQKAAEDAAAEGAGSTDVDVDALIDRLYNLDDILIEEQRLDHYLSLKANLRKLLDSMALDYIVITGSRYQEHHYETYIYKVSNLDVVFSHYFIANTDEWRDIMAKPTEKENLSYNYSPEKEPSAYFDLSYAEYMTGLLEIE